MQEGYEGACIISAMSIAEMSITSFSPLLHPSSARHCPAIMYVVQLETLPKVWYLEKDRTADLEDQGIL